MTAHIAASESVIESAIQSSLEPASILPTWEWIEKNIQLPPDAPWQGRVDLEFFPFTKIFLNHCDNPSTRKVTVMKCAQSALTQSTIWYLLRRIKDRPITAMWVMAAADRCEEFGKRRVADALESCEAIKDSIPKERDRWTKKLVRFDSMDLLLRGANSRVALQSDPVGLIICDERREWKKGRIEIVRKRTRVFSKCLEISIGTAGLKNDELHQDWLKGSQTLPHFRCPTCKHSQPFRFGKVASVLFETPRERGGIVWTENDITRPKDSWNWKEFKKTVRFQCEHCERMFHNVEKTELLKTVHEHHRNPDALPEHASLHCPALMLPWVSCDWAELAKKFIEAKDSIKIGDIEPLKEVVEEDFGEPWELRNEKQKESELLERCGDYKLGEFWNDPKDMKLIEPGTVFVITVDRQLMHVVYVIRQWRKNGQSRLVWCGVKPSMDEIREMQIQLTIKNKCVWADDGGTLSAEFRQTCLRNGWNVLKGEDYEHFTISSKDSEKSYRQGWRATEFDPGVGTTQQGRAKMTAYLWSNIWFKDKLYNIFTVGKGPLWELPKDVPPVYVKEVMANDWREKTRSDGRIEGYWHESGPDHFADCELEQLVVADIAGLTRALPR